MTGIMNKAERARYGKINEGTDVYFYGGDGLEKGLAEGKSGGKIAVRDGKGALLELDIKDVRVARDVVYFQGDFGADAGYLLNIMDGMAYLDVYGVEESMDPACVFLDEADAA